MPCLVTMSQEELKRLEVIQRIRDRRLSVVQAADLLRLRARCIVCSKSTTGSAPLALHRAGAAGRAIDATMKTFAIRHLAWCETTIGTLARRWRPRSLSSDTRSRSVRRPYASG